MYVVCMCVRAYVRVCTTTRVTTINESFKVHVKYLQKTDDVFSQYVSTSANIHVKSLEISILACVESSHINPVYICIRIFQTLLNF